MSIRHSRSMQANLGARESTGRALVPPWLYVGGTIAAAVIAVGIVVSVIPHRATAPDPSALVLGHPVGSHQNATPSSSQQVSSSKLTGAKDPLRSSSRSSGATSNSTSTSTSTTTSTSTSTTSTTAPISTSLPSKAAASSRSVPSLPAAATEAGSKFESGDLGGALHTIAFPFGVAAGTVSADATFHVGSGTVGAQPGSSDAVTFAVTLTCPGATRTQRTASGGTYLSLSSQTGTCTITLSERPASEVVVSYDVALTYQQLAS